jgi:hypothetical protein
MRQMIICALAMIAAATFSSPARACRVMQSTQQRISDLYSETKGIQVALIRIVEARHLSFPMMRKFPERFRSEEAPWRAAAIVTQVIFGEETPEILVFDRGWGSAACDDGTALPKRGDMWVAYYRSGAKGEAEVVATYPLRLARVADPRLRTKVR